MSHNKNHSFTGTSDHDFTGLISGQLIQYNGTGIVSAGAIPTSGNLWSASTGINSIIANNGSGNIASGSYSMAFGSQNTISGNYGIVSGYNNKIQGAYTTALGGYALSSTTSVGSFMGGGRYNLTKSNYTSLLGGYRNTVESSSSYSSAIGGKNNIVEGFNSSIIGGSNNIVFGGAASIIGGNGNKNYSTGFIGGGLTNTIANGAQFSGIIAGRNHSISGRYSFIGGGFGNTGGTSSRYSAVVGGQNNVVNSFYSAIVGGKGNIVTAGANNSAILGGSGITADTANTVYVPRLNVKSGVTLNQGTGVLNEAEDYGIAIGLNSPVSTDKTVILGDIYDLTSPPVTGVDNALFIGGSALGVQDIYFISQDRDNNTENYLAMGTNGAVIRHNDNSVSPNTKSQVQVNDNILIESTTLSGSPDAIIDIVSRDEDSLLRSQLTVHKSSGITFGAYDTGGTLSEVIYGINGFVGQTNELKFRNGNTLINLNSASNSVSISGATTNINSNAILAGNTGVANTLSFQGSDATINSPSANYLNLVSGYRIAFKTYSTLNAQLDSSTFYLYTHLNLANAKDIIVGSSSGTKIATSPSQKLGFWNATPVVQPSSATTVQGIADALTSIGILASGSTITGGGTVDYKYTTATTFTANVTKTITHSLNSEDIIVNIWEDSPKIQTDGLVEIVDSNTIKVTMGVTDTFKVVIIK